MAKKIYDIKPLNVAKKIENTIKEISSPAIIHKKPKHNRLRKEANERRILFTRKSVIITSVVLIFALGIYLYNSLQKVTVEIYPVVQNLSFQNKVKADTSVKAVDLSSNLIPADLIEMEKDGQQDFPATGISSTDSKATGTITIYNKYDPISPITLLKGTHFLSDSGKYFITLNKITIPAARYQGGKLVPGSVTVDVQAEGVGPDYNIGPSNFSVPKLAGTAYYYSIFAESSNKMVGGSIGKVKKVTNDDLNFAKEVLTNKLFNDAENSIRESLSNDDIMFKNSIEKNVINSNFSDQLNSTVDNFTATAKVKVSALVFKKSDLNEFIKNYIFSKLKEKEEFLPESIKIDYSLDTVNLQKGEENINLNVSYQTYHSIDQDSLIKSFKGKSSLEIKDIIASSYPDSISQVKVNLWPFWTTKAPNSQNMIKIKLNFAP